MKPYLPWLLLPLALGTGFFAGKQAPGGSGPDRGPDGKNAGYAERGGRDTKVSARGGKKEDPFGGPAFSLTSLDDIKELNRQQGYAVASARLTLAASQLSLEEIPDVIKTLQADFQDGRGMGPSNYELISATFERWVKLDTAGALEFAKNCKSRSFRNMAVNNCFSALSRENPDQAMQEYGKLPEGELRKQASPTICWMIAQKDPVAALDFMEKNGRKNGYEGYYVGGILAKWAETDPLAAAARMASMPPDRVNGDGAGQLAAEWAKKDPKAALEWAKGLRPELKNAASLEIYKALSRKDPEAAWKQLQDEPGHLRGQLTGGVLQTVADEDPAKAVAMLKAMDSKPERRIAVEQFLQQMGYWDTEGGFKIIDELKDPLIRRSTLDDLMSYASWYSSEDEFKAQVDKMSDREKIDTSGSVMQGLMRNNPEAARDYFLSLPETQRDSSQLSELMGDYAGKDARKALEMATAFSNPQEQASALNGLFNSWSRLDPKAAAEGLKQLPEGQSRLEALGQIADSWGNSDPQAAKAWAEGLSGDERTRALATVLPQMAKDNPAAAASQLLTLLKSPSDGMEKDLASSAGSLAGTWASDDPAAAAKWAANLPPGQSREQGLQAVASSWAQYDAAATAQWLGTLEAGSSRDAAIAPLVSQIQGSDPAMAFTWASSISDENDRLNQLKDTLGSWRKSDLKAARAAFDAANLTDKERESLGKELE